MSEVLYCPVCGQVLTRQELMDTTIWYCPEQKEHKAILDDGWPQHESE